MSLFALGVATSLLALVVASLVPWAAWVSGRALSLPHDEWRGLLSRGVWWVGLVLLVSGVAAALGLLRDFSRLPPPMMAVLLPVTIMTLYMASSSFGERLARGVPLWALVGFQGFRFFVELILLGLYERGELPRRMTFEGANFDVITALSAVLVAFVLYRAERPPRWLVLGWNCLGLFLVLTIATIGILSTPIPVHVFSEGPANRIMAEFPFIWVPVIFVQAAIFGHILVFRALRQLRG